MAATPFDDAVGAAHVSGAGASEAVDEVAPRWVVRPGSAEEVAAVVRAARDDGLALVARGSGRHLALGEPPLRADAVVSTARLDAVVAHEPADMTVRVQAGCTLAALDRVLRAAGQWLPLDPPAAGDTTVGGLVATNLSGPLHASQGTARDFLIGLRVASADGALVSGGGRVVKNVAGYDLPKMHVGALGTLGILVEATFKVRPRPAHEEALSIGVEDAGRAAALALALRDACEPLWLTIDHDAGDAGPWRVAVAAGGRREEVDAALDTYRRVAREHGAAAAHVADAAALRARLGGDEPAGGARLAGDEPAAGARIGGDEPASGPRLRASTLPTAVGVCVAALRSAARSAGGSLAVRADVASGVVRAHVRGDADLTALVRAARPPLEATGGLLVVERATAAEKRALRDAGGVWGDPGPSLALMRGLKRAFDPQGRFSPGRFVGGL